MEVIIHFLEREWREEGSEGFNEILNFPLRRMRARLIVQGLEEPERIEGGLGT